jgi:hypothetical protein
MADTPWAPGPWRNVAGELVSADGQRVVLAAFRGGLVSAHGNPRAVANTAIAEAAPEMAAVLQSLIDEWFDERTMREDPFFAEARALLARIKGEEA